MDPFRQAGAVLTLQHRCGNFEPSGDDFYCAGAVFQGDTLLATSALRTGFMQALSDSRLGEWLRQCNGFFTLAAVVDGTVYLVTDRLRSRPLFYTVAAGQLRVSDCAAELFDAGGLDLLSAEEYLRTGYVTGADTLVEHVQQVQAAEIVSWRPLQGLPSGRRYGCFMPRNPAIANSDPAPWLAPLDAALLAATRRLLAYANDRQVVLPLSGGYDSRAIALYLKKLGYGNVLCFTFGRPGSPEVETSRQIAQALELPWQCVTYTPALWRSLRKDPDFINYLDFIHNGVSVPNIQVYPAIKALLASHHVATNAVLVPGHTGDFVAGGHMPPPGPEGQPVSACLHNAVARRHYKFSREPMSAALAHKLDTQLQQLLEVARECGVDNPISIAEAWNYRERQAKFIVNSNRYYDFFGLDWWMPLWDQEFVALWERVPYTLRKDKRLWIYWLEQQMQHAGDHGHRYGNAGERKTGLQRYGHRYLDYFFDHNHLLQVVPFRRWLLGKLRLTKKPGALFGYLADYTLRRSANSIARARPKLTHATENL